VEAEYRSASVAHHLTLWLIQIAASPDLIRAGLRIAADELTHSELSYRAFIAAGGEGSPHISRETLGLSTPAAPLEQLVTRAGVDVFCLGETVAVPLFKTMREGCTVPAARRVVDRVLRDEVRHRDFGWSLLGWLMEGPAAASVREQVASELPYYFARVRKNYSGPSNARLIEAEERAWGLIDLAEYVQIVDRTLERDWVPRFGRHDIDARAAWSRATGLLNRSP
jgi:hypothetical protein